MQTVLVIDDEELIRGFIRLALEREGYEVREAHNGEIGLRMYRQEPADLVITDIIMPDKEGLETIRTLKRENTDVRIIAMSGGGPRMGHDYCLQMANKLGVVKSLAKPFGAAELLEAVKEALDQD